MSASANVTTSHPLAGVYAAAVTPFDTEFRPSLDGLRGLLEFLASRGCHGALLLGTTGEGPSRSRTEREAIMRAASAWRAGHPAFRLLAGTGTPSLGETVELTKLAFDLGFEGVVVLPPYYFRNAGEDGLFAWFKHLIGQAVPGDGLLLGYHFPGTAGIGFSLDLLSRLKDAFPSQFAGLKDSAHDIEFSKALGLRFGSDLAVFSGTDSDLLVALQHRAAGCITAPANLMSPRLREIYDLFRAGGDAAETQREVARRRHVLERHLPFPPILKSLMHRLHGLPDWTVKPPLQPADEDAVQHAANDLEMRN